MNCQDIARILDDGDIDLLPASEQREAEAHRTGCPHCALDWRVHQRLATSSAPALPVTLAARCRALVAAQAAAAGRRMQSRVILFGTVLVVAAAAAMLGLQMMQRESPPVVAANGVDALPMPAVEPPIIAAIGPAEEEQPSAEQQVSGPRASLTPPPVPQRFIVRIEPIVVTGAGDQAVAALRQFESALHEGLRRVPGLILMTPDSSGFAPDAPADYQLQLSGAIVAVTTWMAELRVQKLEGGKAPRTVYSGMHSGGGSMKCGTQPGPVEGYTAAACPTPSMSAAIEVDRLRLVVFPPDPAFRQQLLARALDRKLDESLRLQVLGQLISGAGSGAAKLTDAEARAALDIAAHSFQPASRRQAWSFLRNSRQPEMLQPLMAAARTEPDESTRLEALSTLVTGFAAEASARQVLQDIAARDANALHRGIAQRALSGEAVWAQFVKSNLRDRNLSGPSRIEPLVYLGQVGQFDQTVSHLDAEAMQTIGDLLPELLRDRKSSSSIVPLYSVFGRVNDPAVVDVYMQTMRILNTPQDGTHAVRQIAMHALTNRFREEPRVRVLLQDLAANDVSSAVRRQAADALQGKAAVPASPAPL